MYNSQKNWKIKKVKESSHASLPNHMLSGLSSKKEILSKLSSITESDIYEYSRIYIDVEWEKEVYGKIKKHKNSYYAIRSTGINEGKTWAEIEVYDGWTDHNVTEPNGSGDDDWHCDHSHNVEFIKLCFGDDSSDLTSDNWIEGFTEWFKENPEYITSYIEEMRDEVKESK